MWTHQREAMWHLLATSVHLYDYRDSIINWITNLRTPNVLDVPQSHHLVFCSKHLGWDYAEKMADHTTVHLHHAAQQVCQQLASEGITTRPWKSWFINIVLYDPEGQICYGDQKLWRGSTPGLKGCNSPICATGAITHVATMVYFDFAQMQRNTNDTRLRQWCHNSRQLLPYWWLHIWRPNLTAFVQILVGKYMTIIGKQQYPERQVEGCTCAERIWVTIK